MIISGGFFWFVVILCVSAIFLALSNVLFGFRRAKKSSDGFVDSFSNPFQVFLLEDGNFGQFFVKLVEAGRFRTLKIKNHGKQFNDDEHLADFRKSLRPEISTALGNIGEIYGKYYF